jgi:hypothetical protein
MRSTNRQIATARIKTAPLLIANLFGSGRFYRFASLMECGNELSRAGTRWNHLARPRALYVTFLQINNVCQLSA